jgi:hypothetical protein
VRCLIGLKQDNKDVDVNTHAIDADTNVDVNVDMIARQGPSGPFYPLGNHGRSALRKTAQPILETCQQTM